MRFLLSMKKESWKKFLDIKWPPSKVIKIPQLSKSCKFLIIISLKSSFPIPFPSLFKPLYLTLCECEALPRWQVANCCCLLTESQYMGYLEQSQIGLNYKLPDCELHVHFELSKRTRKLERIIFRLNHWYCY